jgi:hypothetical protein
MDFHRGQLVVCISDRFSDEPIWRRSIHTLPKLRAIYTIRDICYVGELVGLMFVEILHEPAWFGNELAEPAFNAKNFRPVRKTNIDIFKKMLEPSPRDLVDA